MAKFKKAKLSHKAIDAYMLKYVGETPHSVPYTTIANQKVLIDPSEAMMGTDEYLYLLGQISAIHKKIYKFPISHMAVLRRSDGKDVLWTKNADLIKSFVHVGNSIGLLQVVRGTSGMLIQPNRALNITPVIHQEGGGMDD